MDGIHFLKAKSSPLFCDNDTTIKLAEDQVWHSKCKYIRMKYHYTRDQILAKELIVNHIANIFTKVLSHSDFLQHQGKLGLVMPAVEEEEVHIVVPIDSPFPFNPYHILYTYDTFDSDSLGSLDTCIEEEC
jgi:hypothetical protein